MTGMKAWNVKQIASELESSFKQCETELEKSVWRVYAARDVKEVVGLRKLTPGEQSILDNLGINIQ